MASLTSFMRQLRPLLPKPVERVDAYHYRINDRAEIKINYFCRWDKPSEKAENKTVRSCYPASVVVAPYFKHLREALKLRQFDTPRIPTARTRTIQRRKDGTINVESIGIAIQKICTATDEYITERKKENETNNTLKRKLAEEATRLEHDLLKQHKMLRRPQHSNKFILENEKPTELTPSFEVHIFTEDGVNFTYYFEYGKEFGSKGVRYDQLINVVDAAVN